MTAAHHATGAGTLGALALAAALGTALAAVRASRTREHTDSPPGPGGGTAALEANGAAPEPEQPATPELPGGDSLLWRMRTTVRETPGTLATLCTALAQQQVDILSLQTLPLGLRPGETPSLGLRPGETPSLGLRPGEVSAHGQHPEESSTNPASPDGAAEFTVDEFLLRAPGTLEAEGLRRLVTEAGGLDTWLERADTHELVDTPVRILNLATRTALDAAELPLALRELLGRCTVHSVPARSRSGQPVNEVPPEGMLEEHVLRLPDPAGGAIVVERPQLPFTPAEFARARALVALDTRLGQRLPRTRDALTLPQGQELTLRRADTRDLPAARAMQERCSQRTLALRYHGPVGDAERYLEHLLSPRFGRTLAAETASGKLVALGHLLWDGEESEVALLVEDAWQQRGVGAELLRQLVSLATEAHSDCVYAVTQASNTGMVAAMRGLGLPLDYQVEEGTLVVTAQLATVEAPGSTAGPACSKPAPEPN